MQRRKKDKNVPAANPTNIHFPIPEDLAHIVLHDTGIDDARRILALGHTDFLSILESDLLFGDGTFNVVPDLFFQLYTIHSQVGNNFPPCLYFLLPNKTRITYDRMITILKELVPACNPTRFLLDFEKAPIGATEAGFPNCSVSGCYFHFTQSIMRHVQSLGLKKKYESEPRFSTLVRSIPALAFVPKAEVKDVFKSLSKKFPKTEACKSLLNYFEGGFDFSLCAS